MNATTITTSKVHTRQPDSGRAARPAARVDIPGGTDPARAASLRGAADGAVIGLVIGAVFAIATVWPISLAALAAGVILGAAWGAALTYLDHAAHVRTTRAPEPSRPTFEGPADGQVIDTTASGGGAR
jgi:hypothetical protein